MVEVQVKGGQWWNGLASTSPPHQCTRCQLPAVNDWSLGRNYLPEDFYMYEKLPAQNCTIRILET